MAGGGGKGGKQTTSVEIPAWLEDTAKQNLARAEQASSVGYVPYMGPDVAAFSPLQTQAMQTTNAAANALGLGVADPMAGVPAPTTYAGGLTGYSSYPMYQQSIDALQAVAPGQVAALNQPFIDPVTGQPRGLL